MLKGDRVKLGPVKKEYINSYLKWMNDRELTQYLQVYRPLTREMEEDWLNSLKNREGFFIFAILFSVVPGKIANKSQRMVFIAIVFAGFIAYLYGIHTQLQLWFQNGQKTASLIPVGTILFTPIFGNL